MLYIVTWEIALICYMRKRAGSVRPDPFPMILP